MLTYERTKRPKSTWYKLIRVIGFASLLLLDGCQSIVQRTRPVVNLVARYHSLYNAGQVSSQYELLSSSYKERITFKKFGSEVAALHTNAGNYLDTPILRVSRPSKDSSSLVFYVYCNSRFQKAHLGEVFKVVYRQNSVAIDSYSVKFNEHGYQRRLHLILSTPMA